MPLRRLKLILVPTVLALAVPAWAETRPASKPAPARPLDLSLPRETLAAPPPGGRDETAQRNLRAAEPAGAGSTPVPLRYGAGYEQRQQLLHGAPTTASPASGAGPGAGGGRRGR
ncbi:MAG: hypothetical protein ACLGG2_00140 [Gammaproteobacteria bacterium]